MVPSEIFRLSFSLGLWVQIRISEVGPDSFAPKVPSEIFYVSFSGLVVPNWDIRSLAPTALLQWFIRDILHAILAGLVVSNWDIGSIRDILLVIFAGLVVSSWDIRSLASIALLQWFHQRYSDCHFLNLAFFASCLRSSARQSWLETCPFQWSPGLVVAPAPLEYAF